MARLIPIPLLAAALMAAAVVGPTRADVLVTTDGSVVETQGPWQQRGKMIIFTLENGRLSSLRAEDVDFEATSRWRDALEATEGTGTTAEPPDTPRARIVITDADVAHAQPSLDEPAAGTPPATEATSGEGPASTGSTATRSPVRVTESGEDEPADGRGRRVFGTLRNDGNSFATGITVEISVYDNDGAIASTQTATPVKTSLRPGESTTFSLQFADVYVIGATRMVVQSLDLDLEDGGVAAAADNDFGES